MLGADKDSCHSFTTPQSIKSLFRDNQGNYRCSHLCEHRRNCEFLKIRHADHTELQHAKMLPDVTQEVNSDPTRSASHPQPLSFNNHCVCISDTHVRGLKLPCQKILSCRSESHTFCHIYPKLNPTEHSKLPFTSNCSIFSL